MWLNVKCLRQTRVFEQLGPLQWGGGTVFGSCRTLKCEAEMEEEGHWKIEHRFHVPTILYLRPTATAMSAPASAPTVTSHSLHHSLT